MTTYNDMSTKLDAINDKVSQTQIAVEELRGDVRVVKEQLTHKVDKSESQGCWPPRQKQALIYSLVAILSAVGGLLTAKLGG